MPLGGNRCLRNQHGVANCAMLACGKTRRRAGRRNGRVNDLGMPLGGNRCLRNQHGVADRAMLACG